MMPGDEEGVADFRPETGSDVSGEATDDGIPEKLPLSLYLIEAYLCFLYLRPQHIIPVLSPLRLPLVLTVILGLLVLPRIPEKLADRKVIAFGALLFFMLFHVPVAVNNFWALMILQEMLFLLIAYMAITQVVTTLPRLRHLLTVWLAIHAALSLYGITYGGRGPGGFVGDENDLALVLVMLLPFPFFLLSTPAPPVRKPLLFAILGVCLGGVFATKSRGGFLGLLAVSLYCLWKTPRKILSVAVLALCVLLGSFAAPAEYWDRISTILGEATGEIDGTGTDRWWTWSVALEMFLDNPVVGVGQGNFPWTIGMYEGAGFRERSFSGRAAHSIYLTLLPELGILGVLIFLCILLLLMRDLRFRVRGPSAGSEIDLAEITSIGHALQASLVGYLVSGAFISAFYYPPFWLLLAFSTSLKRVILDATPDPSESNEPAATRTEVLEPPGAEPVP